MKLDPALARFVGGPVMLTLGSRDTANRPAIGRGSGVWLLDDLERLEVAIGGRLWADTVANLRDNGMLAVTAVQPADYRAFQFKGRASLRPAGAGDEARARRYVAETTRLLEGLGVPEPLIRHWLTDSDIVVATLAVDRVFEQTPGVRAGVAVA